MKTKVFLKYFVSACRDIKKTWNVMKDKIGKSKIKLRNLPRKLTINRLDF